MTLLENIREEQVKARKGKEDKDKIAASLLTTLLGEAEMVGKNNGNRATTDAEVVTVIKKFVKNVEETINHVSKQDNLEAIQKRAALEQERDILNSFLPKQLTEEELRQIIGVFVSELVEKNPKQMGKVLGQLKDKYAGTYDGALASKITKELLV